MDELVKIVAKYFLVLSVLGAAVVLYRMPKTERLRFVILLAAGGIVALAFAKLGSMLYDNPRPFVQGHFTPLLPHAADNGFPSDHTLLAAFLAWASLTKSRKIGAALLVVALLVGLARLQAGVHHAVDIAGSFVLSGLACWLVWWLVQRFVREKSAE